MDNNSLSHTKWNCKYHIGATCGGPMSRKSTN